jgi:Tfp pilus assembly protein PilO
MSGIEVVGLVLGAVPLVISALEHYAEGVETIRRAVRYKKELTDLVHDLQAEYLIYQDTTEWLLRSLVTESELQHLLEDLDQYPHCARWKDQELEQSLEKQLGRSYDLYLKTVEDMNDVMKQFKARLDLSKEGTVSTCC